MDMERITLVLSVLALTFLLPYFLGRSAGVGQVRSGARGIAIRFTLAAALAFLFFIFPEENLSTTDWILRGTSILLTGAGYTIGQYRSAKPST